MSKKAVTEYKASSEKEYIEQNVLSVKFDNYFENISSEKLGKILYDRNLENSSKWDIIVEKENNKSYGTNWNYIGKGTALQDYGETQYSWLVNYETGEIIQLEDENYNNFDYKSTVAVTDNLLFNLESANVGLDKASWGNNATLYCYDKTQYNTVEERKKAYENQKKYESVSKKNEGYDRQQSDKIEEYIDEDTGAFNFNGNNYIEIYNKDGFDFSEGMTFEFYGKITGNESATATEEDGKDWGTCCGMLGIWNGNYSEHCTTRFLYLRNNNNLTYRLFDSGNETVGEWGGSLDPWNQRKSIGDVLNKELYFAITFENKDETQMTQSVYVYVDGKQSLLDTGYYKKDVYDEFVNIANGLDYIELGRCSFGGLKYVPNWCYLKGLCYSTRIYNKSLTKEEVQENYDKTTNFHKYIIENKDKG